MPVCRNWTGPGSCRFGEKCRFDHPEGNSGFSNHNRYAPLDNSSNRHGYQNDRNGYQNDRNGDQNDRNSHQSGASNPSNRSSSQQPLEYQLDEKAIRVDLSSERPQWILSAYGPGRNAPEQLFGGSRTEQSFEEMRVAHYLGLRSGNVQQVAQEADKLKQETEQQIQFALNNIDGAIKYIIDAAQKHPNRIDIVQECMAQRNHENVFAEKENPNRVEFQPSSNQFGQNPNPSQPAFGAPTQLGTGAFGQPSALGAKPNPFAAPSQSAFGAASQPAGSGAFDQPSSLGAKANPFGTPAQPAFGTPSQPGGGGVFGQPSSLGAKPNPFATEPAFGAPSQSRAGGAFGQPSTLGQKPNPFSSQPSGGGFSSFANPGIQPASNPFGQSTSQSSQPSNPFAQAQQTPFNGSLPAVNDPFAQSTKPNPFTNAETSKPNNPFTSANPTPVNPFSSNPSTGSNGSNQVSHSNAFGNPSLEVDPGYKPLGSGGPSRHPPLSSYATSRPDGKLAMFRGKPVVYKDGEPGCKAVDGSWQKIWFPEGPPKINKDSEMIDVTYDNQTTAAYDHLRHTGAFQDGVLPMLPPKQEWCLWDF